MRLFNILDFHVKGSAVWSGHPLVCRKVLVERTHFLFKKICDLLFIEVAGDGDNNAVSGVASSVIFDHSVMIDAGKTLRGSKDGTLQRIAFVHQFRNRVVNLIVRRILHHLDFFQDDLTFFVDFLLCEL